MVMVMEAKWWWNDGDDRGEIMAEWMITRRNGGGMMVMIEAKWWQNGDGDGGEMVAK